jgi:hypothetical protein
MKEKEWYKERAHETLRMLAQEQERLTDEAKGLEERMRMVEGMESLMDENERLQEETDSLRQQIAEERQKRTEMETKMNEMSKLSAGMAKKAAQDDFHKALRIYLNISKRKTIGKREAAKDVIMGLMTSAKLELPDDIMELLEHLDDEQSEPKTVTVNGNYIEAHDNKEVKVTG